ncbi:rod shape-determining protein MreD [Legionella jordanis]|uniref:Rod shape-determining protein MreD n=1 Tax=Legionella jordanis TaxID=456 RepID=A0A0W0VFI9_9GAMM|nr:rod shape-determining protein MreD [Legionella jordanis]KTD18917.1 rod shape-determining protein MreD [Legionella jordanis]RMX05519.1 rod shape-determining protein MreD [Legionella jordanis]RMX19204.1 rod shape-determining protein MreD [Legionella jordanis]VEH13017.1 rod shape determining protein MreD [Legionella jordanis]HAT8714060.1 rod shape-determining protein MreD [Legionella jordanis]
MNSLGLRLFVAVILALALTILPLPELLTHLRPPWVLILVLYLQFFLPNQFNLFAVLIVGLLLDVLLSTVLGEHAFALALVTWIASSKERRFNFFPMWQQMALIGFFCLLYQLLIFIVEAFLGYRISLLMLSASAGVSMVLWPWVRLIADDALRSKAVYAR